MTAVEIGFFVLVTAAVLAIALGVRSSADRRRAELDRRLRLAESSGVGLLPPPPPRPDGVRTRFDQWFERAVLRSGLDASPAGVTAVMLLAAVVLGSGLYFWKGTLGLTALAVTFGFVTPLAVVIYLQGRYRRQLQLQLPDAYRTLAGSVRAGQTLEQAIEFYAREGNKPLADEFGSAVAQMRLGLTPTAALKSVADRIRLLDFDLLVSTTGLYATTGGNLVLLLERLSESVRDRNQFRRQFFSATAQSRIVAIALGVAAPLLLLVYALGEPEHVETFFSTSRGWTILAGCLVLEAIGVVWLWQILRIED